MSCRWTSAEHEELLPEERRDNRQCVSLVVTWCSAAVSRPAVWPTVSPNCSQIWSSAVWAPSRLVWRFPSTLQSSGAATASTIRQDSLWLHPADWQVWDQLLEATGNNFCWLAFQVVTLYLSCLPQSQHALVLERLRYAMPNNIELGLRYTHSHTQ